MEGVVALYAPDAVLAFPPGQLTAGHDQIRAVYRHRSVDVLRAAVGGTTAHGRPV